MSTDTYSRLVRTAPGAMIARRLGLPRPERLLRREDRPQPVLDPVVVLGRSSGAGTIARLLLDWGADVHRRPDDLQKIGTVVAVLDEVTHPGELGEILLPLAGAMRSLRPGARVVTISRPAGTQDAARDAARGGVEGFVRSLAHEMRRGGTANGILVADEVPLDAPAVVGALRFLLSARSAFVDGQFLHVDAAGTESAHDRPLSGRTALVTGAARGIGAAIARTLHADGARLVLLDVPAAGTELARLANDLRAVPLQLDVTAADAGDRLVTALRQRGLQLDVVVHNAGITRDKLFANMTPERWDPVIGVNIAAPLALHRALLEAGAPGTAEAVLGERPRVVCLASTSGIAGNRGQTNYAASKAGMVAVVRSMAQDLAPFGGTANAVAPGFIETDMTARIPAVQREIARRVNSLQQGGLPVDVAETVAFLASDPAGGLRGDTVRVCGQNIVGK
ncbi:3-oxoacyl-ACP reductase [Brachybacterium sp. EF45031]|uniref:3-oxoacyl-ACP reductase n=1 Tax=Brachybacterium sillae TaxID=2810536 RepID=UPI00217DC8E7|nr:3-oxoacyl-ACP reductase [Brachybacterium sillae]MCS6711207.1 3-oxoacyl-ACP reductase [Brachybacterium sillae]